MNRSRSSDYVPISYPNIQRPGVRLIAFYLPQFHPIPENDKWWGKGFTEWTNVSRAIPQFMGHYQPRLPGELGFYDLRVPEVQERQIELARQYGIYGFCFHFYWFNGRALLERPLEQFLSSPEMDLPFCVNWANENWTRRWDGLDNDKLIEQMYSPDDDIAFIKHVSRCFRDSRYIRIDSRPLLIVYKPALLPNPRETASRWRQWCRENGLGEIYLAFTEALHHIDPRKIGFDAAIEFAGAFSPGLKDITSQCDIANDKYKGRILDYVSAVEAARDYKPPAYKKFRGVCPGWDNEARREGRGIVLANSSPTAYGKWLHTVCEFTVRSFAADERMVFINAWNEWGEGAYLEPDRRHGYAYLAKTAEVLSSFIQDSG